MIYLEQYVVFICYFCVNSWNWQYVCAILKYSIMLLLRLLISRLVSTLEPPFRMLGCNVTIELLYAKFVFLTRTFYKRVPGCAAYCPCGVQCHGLTTCLLYCGPFFGHLVLKQQLGFKFDISENVFLSFCSWIYIYMISLDMIIPYFVFALYWRLK